MTIQDIKEGKFDRSLPNLALAKEPDGSTVKLCKESIAAMFVRFPADKGTPWFESLEIIEPYYTPDAATQK